MRNKRAKVRMGGGDCPMVSHDGKVMLLSMRGGWRRLRR